MGEREKLLQRIRQSPHNVTFKDVRKLLESEEFILDRITGSHHVFRKSDIVFVVPVHHNRVKTVYVKRMIEIIEEYDKS